MLSQFQPHAQGSQLNGCVWDDRVRFLTDTEVFLVTIVFGPALGPTEPKVQPAPSTSKSRRLMLLSKYFFASAEP